MSDLSQSTSFTPDESAWLRARIGCLTASRMADAMSYLKDGKTSSAARTKLLYDVLAERMTDSAVSHYVTPAMEWGRDNEQRAVAAFEEVTGYRTDGTGKEFVQHPTIAFFGASPDRWTSDGGLLEVKCPTTPTFLAWQEKGEAPKEHRAQMAVQMLCTGAKFVHFFAFDPRIKNPAKRYFLAKFEPSREYLELVKAEAVKFLVEVDAMFDKVNS